MSPPNDAPVESPKAGIFTDLGEAVIRPPDWVIENLLPVGLTLMGAPPKSYKSVIATVTGLLVTGKLDPDKHKVWPRDLSAAKKPGHVAYLHGEASAGELRHLVDYGMHGGIKAVNDGSFWVADDPWAFRLDLDDGQANLRVWLNELAPVLLVIDPLRNFHDKDENSSQEMVQLLKPWREWAIKSQSALLVVHHTAKLEPGQNKYGPEKLRGSSALFGMADATLMVTPMDFDNERTRIEAKFRRGQAWERVFTLGVYGREYSEALEPIDQEVLRLVPSGASLEDVAKQLHKAKSAVVQAASRLERLGYLRKEGKRWRVVKVK